VIAALAASLSQRQRDHNRDFRVIGNLVSTIVECIQFRPHSEGFSPLIACVRRANIKALSSMALILPILAIPVDESDSNQGSQKMTVSAVLGLASFNAMAFKEVLGCMNGEARGRIESLLRSALVQEEVEVKEQAKPSISLKFDFGSVE
jgi:hypothetical protein